MKMLIPLFLVFLLSIQLHAQQVTLAREQIISITPEWKGVRLADGRPHVSDELPERLKNIFLEEAWGIMRNKDVPSGTRRPYEAEHLVMRIN